MARSRNLYRLLRTADRLNAEASAVVRAGGPCAAPGCGNAAVGVFTDAFLRRHPACEAHGGRRPFEVPAADEAAAK